MEGTSTELPGSEEEAQRVSKVSRWDNKRRLETLISECPSVGEILDYGSGYGDFASFCLSNGIMIDCYEPSKERSELSLAKPLDLMDIHSDSYDAITCHHVIEHVDSPSLLIQDLLDFCKPGGKVIIETPRYDCWQNTVCSALMNYQEHNLKHVNNFTMDELKRLVSGFVGNSIAGFTIQSVTRYSILNLANWLKTGMPQQEPHFSAQPGCHQVMDEMMESRFGGDTLVVVLTKRKDNV